MLGEEVGNHYSTHPIHVCRHVADRRGGMARGCPDSLPPSAASPAVLLHIHCQSLRPNSEEPADSGDHFKYTLNFKPVLKVFPQAAPKWRSPHQTMMLETAHFLSSQKRVLIPEPWLFLEQHLRWTQRESSTCSESEWIPSCLHVDLLPLKAETLM